MPKLSTVSLSFNWAIFDVIVRWIQIYMYVHICLKDKLSYELAFNFKKNKVSCIFGLFRVFKNRHRVKLTPLGICHPPVRQIPLKRKTKRQAVFILPPLHKKQCKDAIFSVHNWDRRWIFLCTITFLLYMSIYFISYF